MLVAVFLPLHLLPARLGDVSIGFGDGYILKMAGNTAELGAMVAIRRLG